MTYLRLDRLSKRYGPEAAPAVDGISLDVGKGQFVSFLGPSGSGKTTTLMMIAGFEPPSAGRVLLDGRDIGAVPTHRRNFGMVFQSYALFPHMTAAENVAYPLRMRRAPQAEQQRKVADALEIVGLSDFARRRPDELSGGQQQRVALARALVYRPDLLLMDEPLGALDKNLREQMQIEIKLIQQRLGITLIYVTHDQGEALTMSDLVAVFHRGRIEQVAPPLELYARPATRFVGEFVGESNIVEATGANGRLTSPIGQLDAPVTAEPAGAGKAWALIRPEAVELVPRAAGAPGVNEADIEVHQIIHRGDRVTIIGQSGPTVLRAQIPVRSAADVARGQRVRLRWRRDDVHLIKE
jgi:putative spermidine/putrescine transport system ATP-binding protein